MSMLQQSALSRLWGAPPSNNPNSNPGPNPNPNPNVNANPGPNPNVRPMPTNPPVHPPRNPPAKSNIYGSRNHSTSNLLTTAGSTNTLALHHELERSQSPHSVDGGTARARRKNRERRGTENSLPVTFDPAEFSGDLVGGLRKDSAGGDSRKDSGDLRTPTGGEYRKGQAKLDATADYQVPFPQVTDMATTGNSASRGRRSGAPPPVNSNEQRDWEREQALRSPTLSAHSNTSSSHTTAPTSVSTTNTTANSSAGATAITIPGAYETGSASGGSGVEVTPTRETATKTKRGSAGSASATAANNNASAAAGNNNNAAAAATGFYTQQQLAQHLPLNPSPSHTLQQQGYRASPPPPLPTGSPQAQPLLRAAPAGSPSQAPRQVYAPPPAMAPAAPSSNGSVDSYDAPTLSNRSSFMTTATSNSLPTLPDSPPSPEEFLRSPPYATQHLTQTMTGVPHPVQTQLANILQPQTSLISPIHPRPMNRAPASVLGQTKMAESWTAAPPPEDLDDEVRERMRHLGSERDGATQRERGHRGTGGGSLELKDGAWVQVQAPERQNSVRRPKVNTQQSTNSVPPVPVQQQSTGPAPAMTRTATMPTMRYETMSPPPIREQHSGLHLEFEGKPIPEKPAAPPPSRVNPGRGPSPVPMQSPNGPRGREIGRAPVNGTPPYTYDDPTYGRGRSASHNTYTTTQPKAPPPPPATQTQWAARAPGTGIVPFNEDLDHDEHEQQPAPPVLQHTMSTKTISDQSIVDWANHTQSQHPLTHPNQPQPVPPGLGPIPQAPATAASGERARGRSRSRSRGDQTQVQAPLMDPASMYSQQNQTQNIPTRSPEINGGGGRGVPETRGRSPVPAAASTTKGNTGSGSSETEDLKTPRSPSVPLPSDGYPRFGYGQFSVGPPGTINHIYTQDLGQNGQMYPSMGFAQSQYALHQMGAGSQGMMAQMNGYPHMNGHQTNGRQLNGSVGSNRDGQSQQNGYAGYGYPQDLSSSASGSFLDGWTSAQMDGRGYPNHIRPSAPVPPTPSSGTAPTSVSGDIRNGTQGRIAHAQTVLYNAQSQMHPQQQYPPYNYAQAQMSYAMDPYRAPSVVSSFMASPFSHNPFLPPVEPQSTQSSPSHQPVGLPYVPGPTAKRFGGARMGTKSMGRRRRMMEEFRPESTVPNDTASEAETEGKRARDEAAETEFETETEMEEVWLEESDDDELDNEFHPTYFVNPAKRKRRFEQKWEQMVKLFREIDRETDATMILAAAPPDQHQTHLLLSRAILRSTHYSHTAQEARSVFSEISISRRRERTEALRRARQERQRKKAVDERLAQVTHMAYAAQQANDHQGGGSGSDETSVPKTQTEADLRSALDAAVVSLQEMRRVFDDMETRHREESNRRKEESLSIEKLLTTLLAGKTVPQQSSS